MPNRNFVARVLWKPHPNMADGCAMDLYRWRTSPGVIAGEPYRGHLRNFADMAGIEYCTYGRHTTLRDLKMN